MKTVLLVEDSLTEREVITSSLRQASVTVVAVGSVEEAQVTISSQRPDLIVLDVILPGKSGFEFCRELKSNPDTKPIPIIICSTKGTDVDKMYGNMLGANAYLTKPVNSGELVQTLKSLI